MKLFKSNSLKKVCIVVDNINYLFKTTYLPWGGDPDEDVSPEIRIGTGEKSLEIKYGKGEDDIRDKDFDDLIKLLEEV